MTDPPPHERTLLLRILGHGALRCAEALVLAWIVWFAADVVLTSGTSTPSTSTPSIWLYLVQNGVWEFWEHLILVGDSAVRAGAWQLVLACLCIVCFLRYRTFLARLLEG